ncbi:hypothetical protein B2G71_01910 [Novosphingobium sp. PC22D]|uniref:hypothetical protein n=1 Tax=Novosphingobium sp. PC22D TaxID=1962403 RepID=UPI000BEF9BD8|nr:hypothetical protein [Novosphingobium sp. PC22D]PEQ14377.1 hypothetical protein B2G71_01910 [Novosphingobium sp. PC22D]
MFKIAQLVVRHKVLMIAVIGLGAYALSGNGQEDEGPSSPWSKDAPVQASAHHEGESLTAKIGSYANTAGEYAAENFLGDKDLNPIALGKDAVGNFEKTNDAMAKANGN